MCSGRFRQQGFTLLELVLVVVVMGLAVAISYPALSRGTVAFHLRATGRDVLNCMRYAREKAITEQTVTRVVVDRNGQKIILTDEYGEGSRTYSMPRDVKIERVVFVGQEVFDAPLVIRFLPNGSAESAEILLKSETGGLLKIVTDPITGGARILSDKVARIS